MKKTIIKLAAFATVACAAFSACTKDDTSISTKDNPIETSGEQRVWSSDALTNENDRYCYNYRNKQLIRYDLEYQENMLSIYYPSNFSLENLPDVFCPIMHLESSNYIMDQNSEGMVVMFENMDRDSAISILKGFNDIYAILPVYKEFINTSPLSIEPAGPAIFVLVQELSDTSRIINLANSLQLKRIYNLIAGVGDASLLFTVDHSPVNSVTAANYIQEAGSGHVVASMPLFDYNQMNYN